MGLPLVVACGQMCLLSSENAGFFRHQNLWKQSVDTLDFKHRDRNQGKAASETTFFSRILPGVSKHESAISHVGGEL